jgi:hypothetical protein
MIRFAKISIKHCRDFGTSKRHRNLCEDRRAITFPLEKRDSLEDELVKLENFEALRPRSFIQTIRGYKNWVYLSRLPIVH